MSRRDKGTKWWSNGDNSQMVQLNKDDVPIGDLSGATITARLMSPADDQIGSTVAVNEAAAGADWSTALIHVVFAVADSTWTAAETGLGHYLQLKVVLAGETKFYETQPLIELEEGF